MGRPPDVFLALDFRGQQTQGFLPLMTVRRAGRKADRSFPRWLVRGFPWLPCTLPLIVQISQPPGAQPELLSRGLLLSSPGRPGSPLPREAFYQPTPPLHASSLVLEHERLVSAAAFLVIYPVVSLKCTLPLPPNTALHLSYELMVTGAHWCLPKCLSLSSSCGLCVRPSLSEYSFLP